MQNSKKEITAYKSYFYDKIATFKTLQFIT